MKDLQTQLVIVFCLKQFALQVVEIAVPLLKAKAKRAAYVT